MSDHKFQSESLLDKLTFAGFSFNRFTWVKMFLVNTRTAAAAAAGGGGLFCPFPAISEFVNLFRPNLGRILLNLSNLLNSDNGMLQKTKFKIM